ncbi:NNP family nitrate/nitrite transporter-like MFS transporter [Aquimarina sp. EL_43]|uniref:MFS transporter n=1 Tax=unclassified Aquimarina TaxID=2627091 RepID=UPI0018CB89CA|nr:MULTISPECIES: MFS transporter [unclassified Aquimarina]MBG6132200.1 NNP family nitrate/nitrite transporter-like MFS transporter [Aquimarina sp. EL_35]MBG6152997.1 NNP family nitrate/nitrite transporter-like MFS transporter [Aquimarina sp. EL_32]MBG6171004.1 NNP family nitrate/nitrite transporter-like MFS transporter [Aquimarina sp. EL_43]
MNTYSKSTTLNLLNYKSVSIRTFWITSIAFFLCFFAWFGIVPFMPDVIKDLGLTPDEKWNSIIVAVSGTIFARLLIGKLCDKYGPRICYTWLLIFGAVPVILLGFVQTPIQFIICRLFIGFIGASFVITQFHTSIMFAPNIVGTANATSAGWGNLGGGVNRLGMPLIAATVVSFGVAETDAWRYCMIIAGITCFLMGVIYFFFTKDTPNGNFSELKAKGEFIRFKKDEVSFLMAIQDYRVWILFIVYAACFGMELTVYGTMDDYLQNTFQLERITAGNIVLSFALMNIFARTLGGVFGDRFGKMKGLRGRVLFLAIILGIEGIMLSLFSGMNELTLGIIFLIGFSLTVQMAEGATFSVVPFINKKAIGSISGIVGAGGNVGAFVAAFVLKSKSAVAEKKAIADNQNFSQEAIQAAQTFASSEAVSSGYFTIGIFVIFTAVISLMIKFSTEDEKAVAREMKSTPVYS